MREKLIKSVIEDGNNISKAARIWGINNSTAKVVIRKHKIASKKVQETRERSKSKKENLNKESLETTPPSQVSATQVTSSIPSFTPPIYFYITGPFVPYGFGASNGYPLAQHGSFPF